MHTSTGTAEKVQGPHSPVEPYRHPSDVQLELHPYSNCMMFILQALPASASYLKSKPMLKG
jgi:hypothetical protein